MIIHSYLKGLALGSGVAMLGNIVDKTVAKNSYELMIKENSQLYKQAWNHISLNMVGIGPVVYSVIDIQFLEHTYHIQLDNILYILLIHSLGYYYVHKSMHENKNLYKYHSFHHKFDKFLLPSIGNAVSPHEFMAAYLFPFIASAALLQPTEISFIIAIATISLFNLFIHCKEFENLELNTYMVSPQKHIEHHRVKKKTLCCTYFRFR